MNELSRLSTEDLRKILDETQEQIEEIRAELEQRERQKQHQAVETLELQLERAQIDWSAVRAFFQQVLAELRGGRK